jgi:hypothetical protein
MQGLSQGDSGENSGAADDCNKPKRSIFAKYTRMQSDLIANWPNIWARKTTISRSTAFACHSAEGSKPFALVPMLVIKSFEGTQVQDAEEI